MSDLRDYGRPDCTPTSIPKWERSDLECPHCGAIVCKITVDVDQPLVRGNKGICVYMGCPACPWASPAMVTSRAALKSMALKDT